MKSLILHPATNDQVKRFVRSPAQVVMVSGQPGSGKLTLAKRMAEAALELPEGGIDSSGHVMIITSEDGRAIGIESARQLERFMRLKVPSDKAYNRVAIIEDSHLMTHEAQNALLKTLEEPPAGTLILLTVSYEPALLPTVRSRAQSITVQRPSQESVKEFFANRGHDETAVDRVYALSGGAPGLMSALLEDQDHPLQLATEQARQLLSQPPYERLATVDALSKDKVLAADTVMVLQRMARISLQTSSGPAAKRWQAILEASYQAAEALAASAQPKLALTNLALRF